ncbi:MAG: anhydro-N-acetylmuramic acid kinase, partial [Prochlorococcus sp.]|nr:anhydro-N-acetylmuramic acid kinase [Prochlorococcus sp.]
RCRGIKVQTIEELGLRSEAREALAFALLAWWHCIRHPGSAPSITGARRAAVLGTRVDPG